ncbi:Uncharacterized protein LSUB1_G005422 [Lachnellula subtilissima]|uniref:DUF1989 domain-containing protein n=1 Tax=Lachnellula subtilissima TaxID=602034 RepID=A0A8H8RQ22_9HELO|nr:Uncharacterized protein LSUB1_G005422 [Lachnellula subtilissima]
MHPPPQPSSSTEKQEIPARKGKAARVSKGQFIRLINTHGKQVVDTWAFNAHELSERMSMEHSRAHLDKILPAIGDSFVTNRRDPILTIVQDTTPGNHDTLMAACDSHRYVKQFHLAEYHDNCTDNLKNALDELGEQGQEFSPSPFNIFMYIPVRDGQMLSWEAPTTEAGQFITFRAEMDLIIAFSACPNDCLPINGGTSMPAHFQIW